VLQIELREDLVGSCVVGDVITVLGLVKVLATGDAKPAGEQALRHKLLCLSCSGTAEVTLCQFLTHA
jgi:hypothetical protein